MKSRLLSIVWWLLLIAIPVLAYVDDNNLFSDKSMTWLILCLIVLLFICSMLNVLWHKKK